MPLKFIRYLLLLMTAACLFLHTSAAYAETVEKIRIEGAERIEPATVMTYLDIQPGDDLTQDKLNQSLKTLFGTGLFADIDFYMQGRDLVVQVVENPVINKIAFEGNKQLKNEDLLAEIRLRPRVVFTRTKVQTDVERLLEVYRLSGLFSATIEPKIIKLDQNRVNLVFEIYEGPKTRIRKISFLGNQQFSNAKLESVIRSRETAWYRFLSANDKYDPDRLAFDRELLRRFYLNSGYADFQITSAVAELSQDRKDFFLTFTLEEGERYRIGKISVENNVQELQADWVRGLVDLKEGSWYNAEAVEDTVVNLTTEIGNRQYAFIDVRPRVERRRADKQIDLVFVVNESAKAFVNNININGNVRTLDQVVRREMLLVEGDPFNRTRVQKSKQNIKDLDFFEEVEIRTVPTAVEDKVDIEVDVQEKSTGELMIGAGFSTQDGPLADFRLRERNFLGKGQMLDFSTTLSGVRTEFEFGFTEPYFLNRDLQAGFNVFHITRDLQDVSSYDRRQTGGRMFTDYPLAKNLRQTLSYRLEKNEITNVQPTASLFIQLQQGKRVTSAVAQRLTYDTRNSTTDPTEGGIFRFDTEIAGLGGDARYFSTRIGANYYWPLTKQWIVSVLGEAGHIVAFGGQTVQINERFSMGGTTLRGFERSGVGPRDFATSDALGGNTFYRGSAEVGFPLGLPEEFQIRGHLFSDFGSLWGIDGSGAGLVGEDASLRLSVGAGVSWKSPLGPIRVDVTAPILKEDFDMTQVLSFSFGTSF
ncbi:MAG: outer membrane protein assembly factor BamA [Alphaproteobacteria bacterium]|nr:MAG: outer membrane protein assembly factor BamA [Alphaproteobacteria bacterium]